MYIARIEMALRGHRDSGGIDPNEVRQDGIFRNALPARVDSGDKVLSSFLVESLSNAQYTSSEVRNEIIHCIPTHINE